MERIRKAIEQADRERSQVLQGAATPPLAPPAAAPPPPAAAPRAAGEARTSHAAGQSDFTGKFPYRQTRIVDVPPETLRKNRIVSAMPGHELHDAYKMLRTRMIQTLRTKGWNAIAVTGPATGCGKSLTAINLAISLAMEVTHTVLLVDLDFRKPSIHSYFGIEPAAGISDYLLHDVPLSDMLFSPSIDRLVVLPGRESIHHSSEMLRSPKMVALVNELKTRYPDRLVIFDLPPILQADDALAFAPYADAMLLVAENGSTHREDLQKSLELLKDTPIIGTVLNKSSAPRGGYYQRAAAAPRRWWKFGT